MGFEDYDGLPSTIIDRTERMWKEEEIRAKWMGKWYRKGRELQPTWTQWY